MAKAKFTQKQVRDYLQGKLKVIDQAIIRRLQFLGEKCVNHARTNGSYVDRTGNLRNSIGYVITKNGKIIDQNFEETVSGGNEGIKRGKELADMLADQFGDGYALIVVAGMSYAAAVENLHGLDVLTSAELMAKTEFPRMMKELKANIQKMKP